MLFWLPHRRLALLATTLLVIAIFTLRRTTYGELVPGTNIHSIYRNRYGQGREADSGMNSPNVPLTQVSGGTRPSALPHHTLEQIQSKIHELRAHWAPPSISNHWPPYDEYGSAEYDPNLWEGFDWDHNFYVHNGIRRLNREKPFAAKLDTYKPYPDYNSASWKHSWQGQFVPCEGPRGKLLNESAEDWLMAYSAIPDGFPQPAVGDANVIGIDLTRCFDRYHRLGPYGYGQNRKSKVGDWSKPHPVNWNEVPWGRLQDQCLLSNSERYRPSSSYPTDTIYHPDDQEMRRPKYHDRTAVLIRAWSGYQYTDNDLETIRSLIVELSLLSGSEYEVFLLVNIKNNELDIRDSELRQALLDKHVPKEFHGISILWNERLMRQWYPRVGDWQVYWHQYMPLQWFSKTFPQFNFVWNWEMDARSTGSHYHFLEQISSYAKRMPRKYLWERNQRFYFPAAHGSYEQWLVDTDASIELAATNHSSSTIWGPQPYNRTNQKPIGPPVPHSVDEDNFEWGTNEDADLLTLQPIWDPVDTEWSFKNKIFNFVPGVRPHFSADDPLDRDFTHPEFASIPRRAFINTVSRLSKRQLHAMHLENKAGRTMQAEMWPATVALHHGLKAVYVPHPIWTDRKWPAWYMDAVFNSNGHDSARWSAGKDSVYNHDREHNFAGWSWYYNAEFPRILYRRWLGWPAHVGPEEQFPNNPLRVLGGIEFEEKGIEIELSEDSEVDWGAGLGQGKKVKIGGEGRMCLPPMFLHPVKKTTEPEGYEEDLELLESEDDGWPRLWKWLSDRFNLV